MKSRGYLLPPEDYTYDDLVCVTFQIPNLREVRAAAIGQITELCKWFAWEKTGDNRGRVFAEDVAQAILPSLQIGGCGVNCEELQACLADALSNNSDVVVAVQAALARASARTALTPDGAKGTGIVRYGQRGDVEHSLSREALCIACKKTIDAICETENARRDNVQDLVLAATQVVGNGLTIAAGIGAGPAGLAIGQIITQGVSFGAIALQEMSAELLKNEEYRLDCACAMYRALVDKSVEKAVFENSLDGVTGDAAQLSGAISYMLSENDVYYSFVSTLSAVTDEVVDGNMSCDCVLTGTCNSCAYGDANFVKLYDQYAYLDALNPNPTWIAPCSGVGSYSGTAFELRSGEIVVDLGDFVCVKRIDLSVYLGTSQTLTYQWHVLDVDGNVVATTNYMSYPNDINVRATQATLASVLYTNVLILRPVGTRQSAICRVQVYCCEG